MPLLCLTARLQALLSIIPIFGIIHVHRLSKLLTTEQQLSIFKGFPDPAFVITRSGLYAGVFGGADTRYYHDGSFLVGNRLGDVLSKTKSNWFLAEIDKALASKTLTINEYPLSQSDLLGMGEAGPIGTIWFEGHVKALDFQIQGEDAVLWVASNITERHQLEIQLRTQSETDSLTGLGNRHQLMLVMSNAYDVFSRYGTPTAVMIFDLDEFKAINESHGHIDADQVLISVASICRTEIRAIDFAARLGGDEFVVLMPHTNAQEALPIAERLRAIIHKNFSGDCALGRGATISAGLSQFMPSDTAFGDVLKRADSALFASKRAGRNRITSISS